MIDARANPLRQAVVCARAGADKAAFMSKERVGKRTMAVRRICMIVPFRGPRP